MEDPNTPRDTKTESADGNSSASEIIELNVGGIHFSTTKETLVKYQDCFFSTLLSGKFKVTRDKKGRIFIDRNGKYFEPILDFLRTGEFEVPSGMSLQSVIREAKYYSIPLPIPETVELLSTLNDEWLLDHSFSVISPTANAISEIVLKQFYQCAQNGKEIKSGAFVADNESLWEEKFANTAVEPSYPLMNLHRIYSLKESPDTTINTAYHKFLSNTNNQKIILRWWKRYNLSVEVEEVTIEYQSKRFNEEFSKLTVGYLFVHTVPE